MADGSYQTTSGRKIFLDQFHVQTFDIGWYVGDPEFIRDDVLKKLPERARELFPAKHGLLIKEAPRGVEKAYPKYILFAELLSLEPISPEAHCSSLLLVWFGDHLEVNLDQLISDALRDVVWEEHAVDGYF